jgi:hypothetical protein
MSVRAGIDRYTYEKQVRRVMKKVTEESKLKFVVKDYLKLKGWFVFHNLAGLGVYPGIPDITAIKTGHVVFIELKTPKGKLSENQMKFQKSVELHDGNYFICRRLEDVFELNANIEGYTYYENK